MCPYADKEKRRIHNRLYRRKYRATHPEFVKKEREQRKEYYQTHKQQEKDRLKEYRAEPQRRRKYNAWMREWRKKNPIRNKQLSRETYLRAMKDSEKHQKRKATALRTYYKLKHEVLSHYANGVLECFCCHEQEIEFLSADHFGSEGALLKRAGIPRSGEALYSWLKRNGFPKGIRVSCHNCNQARGYYGYCPHEKYLPELRQSFDELKIQDIEAQ